MPAWENKVYFIALVCFFFFLPPSRRIAVRVRERGKQPGKEEEAEGSKVINTPGSLLAQLVPQISHVGKAQRQSQSLRSAELRQKPKPSSPNGLRLSGAFPLSPLESASQSRYISPGSRTWGLVRDTARLQETQGRFIGWWRRNKQ